MYKISKLLVCILIYQCIGSCKQSKVIFYSYKVNTYTIDTVKLLLTSANLISYGDYVFEFINNIKINSEKNGDADPIIKSFTIDTTGVYLLNGKNKLYYAFDTFATKNKIVQTGLLYNKPFGLRVTLNTEVASTENKFVPLKEIVTNNIKLFYLEILSNYKNMADDSIQLKVMLFKDANFNSPYKINGLKYTDSNYCIVGYNMYSFKSKDGFVQEMDALRPLTQKEKTICELMVAKSKTCVTDTISKINN